MARRGKKSNAEEFIDIVAILPWWAGLGLALASFLFFRSLAAPPKVTGIDPAQVGQLMIATVISGIALAGQYVAPIICTLGAFVSFLRRRERQNLVEAATALDGGAASISGLTWREFELLVGEGFRLQGYTVAEVGGAGPDGGVDLRLRRGNEIFLVQCKQWRAQRVSVDVVRELYGVMAAQGASGGFVVTSGRFTSDAEAFATGRNVKLVDGKRLQGLLQQARASSAAAPRSAAPAANPPPAEEAPACPNCRSAMVLRTARKGPNAGGKFWGCSRFPVCKGAR